MKRISQPKLVLLGIVTALFFSCKNGENNPSDVNGSNNNVNAEEGINENSGSSHNDTTAVNEDTINGTTPTGSNDRGQ